MRMVLFNPFFNSTSRSRISSADFESRSPVGSSATIRVGSVTMARAMPTRLLLAAGELPWPMAEAIGEVDQFQRRQHLALAVGGAEGQEQQRQLDVLVGRQHRQQVVELEDEADVAGPPFGQLRPRSWC